jgi:hypothetical protein
LKRIKARRLAFVLYIRAIRFRAKLDEEGDFPLPYVREAFKPESRE